VGEPPAAIAKQLTKAARMGKIILAIVIGLGFWYWDRGELPFAPQAGAFDADDRLNSDQINLNQDTAI
jgi:hypothetical protein